MNEIVPVLQKLTEYEKGLHKVKLSSSSKLRVDISDSLDFVINGNSYKSKINHQIIHQIGNRIFQNYGNDYKTIKDIWNKRFQENKHDLANDIKNELINKRATLILDSESNRLYGIISDQFQEINQIEFRSEFVECYKNYGLSERKSSNDAVTYFGEPKERFTFKTTKERKVGEPVEYGIEIIYGLNNGYSSYRIALDRTILVCKNGLTSVEKLHFAQLKHIKGYNVPAFIENIKTNVFEYDEFFQDVIGLSKTRHINPIYFNELFRRLHVTSVVKSRIMERFEIEKNIAGNSEWTLSQAFTNLSTHFYKSYSDKHNQCILTEVGSDILDNSLEFVLDLTTKEYPFGEERTYGNLIPRDYQNN